MHFAPPPHLFLVSLEGKPREKLFVESQFGGPPKTGHLEGFLIRTSDPLLVSEKKGNRNPNVLGALHVPGRFRPLRSRWRASVRANKTLVTQVISCYIRVQAGNSHNFPKLPHLVLSAKGSHSPPPPPKKKEALDSCCLVHRPRMVRISRLHFGSCFLFGFSMARIDRPLFAMHMGSAEFWSRGAMRKTPPSFLWWGFLFT